MQSSTSVEIYSIYSTPQYFIPIPWIEIKFRKLIDSRVTFVRKKIVYTWTEKKNFLACIEVVFNTI